MAIIKSQGIMAIIRSQVIVAIIKTHGIVAIIRTHGIVAIIWTQRIVAIICLHPNDTMEYRVVGSCNIYRGGSEILWLVTVVVILR